MFYDTCDTEVTKQMVLLQQLFVELFPPCCIFNKNLNYDICVSYEKRSQEKITSVLQSQS